MRFGINFRRDLAELDDVELASRFEALIDTRAVALNEARSRTPKFMHWVAEGAAAWRGPFHACKVYKIQGLLLFALGQGLLFFAPGGIAYGDYLSYLQGCELKDVADEIRSRIRERARQRGVVGGSL